MGAGLCARAAGWLLPLPAPLALGLALAGLGAGLASSLGFARIAERNLRRLLLKPRRLCLFAFQPWKSWGLVALMVGLGLALRASPLPRPALALVYLAVGSGLLLASRRYLRPLISGGDERSG